jgi:enolase
VLPVPMMNILKRRRALGCANRFSGIHDRCPRGAPSFFRRVALRGTEVYHALKSVLKTRHLSTAYWGRRWICAATRFLLKTPLESISAAV